MQSNARHRSKKDDYKPRSEHLTSASVASASHQSGGRGTWAEDDCARVITLPQARRPILCSLRDILRRRIVP